MTPEQIQSIYDAWKSGEMTPQHVSKYEADIKAGKMSVPPGALTPTQIRNLDSARQSGEMPEEAVAAYDRDKESGEIFAPPQRIEDVEVLDQSVIDAYKAGLFSEEEVSQLQEDIAAYNIKLPEGVELGEPEFVAGVKEQLSGALRKTPEIESLPDWVYMPEIDIHTQEGLKSTLGTMAAGPEEIIKIIKANNPDVEVRYDAKGNAIFKSGIDGNEYAFKPGLRESDFLRGIFVGAAFTPAGRATSLLGQTGKAALTQSIIEDIQSEAGGDFDIGQVALAGAAAGGAYLLGKGVSLGAGALKRSYQRFSGKAAKEVVEEAPPVDIHKLTRDASKGKPEAIRQLAKEAAADPKIIAAADNLGIDLTSGQMTTSQQFRQIHGAAESMTGSPLAVAAAKGREQTIQVAADIVEEARGLKSMNQMSANLRSRMDDTRSQLNKASDVLYKEISGVIEPKTSTPADNLISLLKQKADDFGGIDKLDPSLKKLLKELSPKNGKHPTYAFIENKRKELTRARVSLMQKSEFSNIDKRSLLELEDALMKDQKAVIKFTGKLDKFEMAQALVAQRKKLEENMEFLFSRDLGKSMVGKLTKSVKDLSKQDAEQFINLLEKIPEDMRQEVVATGLQTAFAKNAMSGKLNVSSYTQWYEGLIGNKQARNALFTHLPSETRRSMQNLYRVSKGIDNIRKNFIATGKLTEARIALEGSSSLMDRVWDLVAKVAIAVPFVGAMKRVGAPSGIGIGLSVASSLRQRSTNTAVINAANDLLTSNEFINLVRHQTPEAATRLARTGAWKRFFKAVGKPRELTNPEQWMLSAFQTQRQMKEEN